MKFIPFLLFSALLCSCIPLQQSNVSGGQTTDFFRYYDDYGLLNIGSANHKKTIILLADSSYAISPSMVKYGIHAEPHSYDIAKNFAYIRDHITLISPKGKVVRKIPQNGKWKFHFEFLKSGAKESRDFYCDFWTFYYNPIIHGPPN